MKHFTSFQSIHLAFICAMLLNFAAAQEEEEEASKISWDPVLDMNDTIAIPAGGRAPFPGDFRNYYVIRATHNKETLVGIYSRVTDKCYVRYLGKTMEVELASCRFLNYPLGSMSWLKATTKTLPPTRTLVKAGKTGKLWLYVCRIVAKHGYIMPGTLTYKDKKCLADFGPSKVLSDTFELLSLNMLGMQIFKKSRGIDHFFG